MPCEPDGRSTAACFGSPVATYAPVTRKPGTPASMPMPVVEMVAAPEAFPRSSGNSWPTVFLRESRTSTPNDGVVAANVHGAPVDATLRTRRRLGFSEKKPS